MASVGSICRLGAGAALCLAGCRTPAPQVGDAHMTGTRPLTPTPMGSTVRSWLLCGPFPCDPGDLDRVRRTAHDTDLLAASGGESGVRPEDGQPAPGTPGTPPWLYHESPADSLDFLKALAERPPHENVVAYAYAVVQSDRAQDAWLAVGSDDTVKAFVNGQCVLDRYEFRALTKDQDVVPVKLAAGRNPLLLKVLNGGGGWGATCRVFTSDQFLTRLCDEAQAAPLACEAVFAGERLPGFRLDLPAWANGLAGTCAIRAVYYDTDGKEVATAARPGRYGAIVTITPANGRPRTEYVTLFRRPGDANWQNTVWDRFPGELPPGLGIAPDVVRHQQAILADYCKWLVAEDQSKRGDAAVLLAGLYETPADAPPAVQRTGPWARDQKWWYTLRKGLGTVNTLYLVDLPAGYANDSVKRWPLVLFLHGAGERGDDVARVRIHGPPKRAAAGDSFPFILVSPQCPQGTWWSVSELGDLLDRIQAEFRVDLDRVYCTGLSMGGFGTWAMACEFPDRFAAIAPICGGGDPHDVERIAKLPCWVFHGAKDSVVPLARSEEMVTALQAAGGKPGLTVYPEAGHDSWTPTYDNPAFYEWLLANRRGQPVWPAAESPAAPKP